MNIKIRTIKNKYDIESLNAYFGKQTELSLDDLRSYFLQKDLDLPDATIRWRVHELVKESVLTRIGYGLYQLAKGEKYSPILSTRLIKIGKFIKKNFPTTSYCIWDSGMINEFAHHLSAYPFILVDIERNVAESVYFKLKDEFKGVFMRPNETLINDMLPDFQLPIVVRYLTSESPISDVNKIFTVSIEKLLVDVFCDVEFNFLGGSERRAIFSNAYYKYVVNENKLLRYAARKGRRSDIYKYIQKRNFNDKNVGG